MEHAFTPEAVRVADQLREEIVSGRRAEDSRLVERELATELGVSRVPVREALRILIAEGLATPHPRTFTTVRRFTQEDVEELIEVRSALEVLAFRLAAQRRDVEGLDRLRALVEREESSVLGDDPSGRASGATFHREVIACTGNALLAELDQVISGRMRWLLNQHDDPAEMAREHRLLFEAVAAGDPDRAAELAQAHLATSRQTAIRLREPQAGPA